MANPKKRRPVEKGLIDNAPSNLSRNSMFAGSKSDDVFLRVSQQLSRDLQMQVHDHSACVSLRSTNDKNFISIASESKLPAINACQKLFGKYNLSLDNNEFKVISQENASVYRVEIDNSKLQTLVETVNNDQQKKLTAAP